MLEDLVTAVVERTSDVIEALSKLNDAQLQAPSELPGWTRLTIACHLRYGAEALLAMTEGSLQGEPVSYYPMGRDRQRPGTLVPREGERPVDTVTALRLDSGSLDQAWMSLGDEAWSVTVVEPNDNPDLGPVRLAALPVIRLTEMEVHGSDLGLGLPPWSETFVRAALPTQVGRLNVRRTNHQAFDRGLEGSWLLLATDGPSYKVQVSGIVVDAHPSESTVLTTATIEGTSRDLLALLLGRRPERPVAIKGDLEFGGQFSAAFPGP